MELAKQRAIGGSPLLRAAQEEQLATIQGRGVNPFLADALAQTNRLSGEAYTRNIENLQSKASSMGRYGSSAMGQQAGTAQDVFARVLAEQSGQLAYNSAEAERARQVAAATNAPTMSSADYADIQRLLQVGQGAEGYAQKAIEGQLAAQDIPMQRLQKAAQVFYGAPLETTTTATPTGGK
jgi:cell pole-organizing protein PopZ